MNPKIKKYFYISIAVVCCLAIFLLSFYLFCEAHYDDRIYPGVSINNIDLSGKSLTEAEGILKTRVENILQNDFKFSFKDRSILVPAVLINFKDNSKQNLVSVNYRDLAGAAFAVGRDNNFWLAGKEQFRAAVFGKQIQFNATFDKDLLEKELRAKFGDMETPMLNASLSASLDKAGNIKYNISDEKPGVTIDYATAAAALENNLKNISVSEIILNSVDVQPLILKSQAINTETQIKSFIDLMPFNLLYNNDVLSLKVNTEISKNDIVDCLQLGENGTVVLNDDKVKEYLNKKIVPQINRDVKDARFELKNNRVSVFQVGSDGLALNLDASVENIKKYFSDPANKNVDLVVDKVENKGVKVADNNLMIKEIIGTGSSDFSGSPKNRRRNIAVGSAAVNGLLIAPGDEFSLVAALGNVDETSGYLPELVIKDNKTIPEFGGGLCQVATTLFRAALQSGLPITARQNHSYRVSYYEPAGTDAAVYLPNPDVRFLNDTENYILIQTRTVGNILYFDFWGVKDGRQIEVGKPTIYNIVKPAPTKILESTDIPVGTKKCTEKAHNGADAWFDYKVTYNPGSDNQEIKKKRFTSHYVPWQEVCLIGVKELSTAASSTPVSSVVPGPDAAVPTASSTSAVQ